MVMKQQFLYRTAFLFITLYSVTLLPQSPPRKDPCADVKPEQITKSRQILKNGTPREKLQATSLLLLCSGKRTGEILDDVVTALLENFHQKEADIRGESCVYLLRTILEPKRKRISQELMHLTEPQFPITTRKNALICIRAFPDDDIYATEHGFDNYNFHTKDVENNLKNYFYNNLKTESHMSDFYAITIGSMDYDERNFHRDIDIGLFKQLIHALGNENLYTRNSIRTEAESMLGYIRGFGYPNNDYFPQKLKQLIEIDNKSLQMIHSNRLIQESVSYLLLNLLRTGREDSEWFAGIAREWLTSKSTSIRKNAVALMGKLVPDNAGILARLYQLLGDEDESVRMEAGIAIASIDNNQIVPQLPHLLAGLKSKRSFDATNHIPFLLGQLREKDDEVMPAFIEILKEADPDRSINPDEAYNSAYVIILSLRNMGDTAKPAIPHMIEILKKRSSYHSGETHSSMKDIIRTLEVLHAKDAVPVLREIVADNDPYLVDSAKEAIKKILKSDAR